MDFFVLIKFFSTKCAAFSICDAFMFAPEMILPLLVWHSAAWYNCDNFHITCSSFLYILPNFFMDKLPKKSLTLTEFVSSFAISSVSCATDTFHLDTASFAPSRKTNDTWSFSGRLITLHRLTWVAIRRHVTPSRCHLNMHSRERSSSRYRRIAQTIYRNLP